MSGLNWQEELERSIDQMGEDAKRIMEENARKEAEKSQKLVSPAEVIKQLNNTYSAEQLAAMRAQIRMLSNNAKILESTKAGEEQAIENTTPEAKKAQSEVSLTPEALQQRITRFRNRLEDLFKDPFLPITLYRKYSKLLADFDTSFGDLVTTTPEQLPAHTTEVEELKTTLSLLEYRIRLFEDVIKLTNPDLPNYILIPSASILKIYLEFFKEVLTETK